MSKETVNSAGFFIRNEAGKVTDAGFILFERRDNHTVQTTIKFLNDEAVTRMVETMPPGGYCVTDKMSGGRIELVTADMDASIPYCAVTDAIENLREHFNVPLSQECKAEADRLMDRKTIAVKPKPTRS